MGTAIPVLATAAVLTLVCGHARAQNRVADPETARSAELTVLPEVQTIFPQRRRPRQIMPHWQPVEVKAVDADVVITGETARTTLAVTLFNPSSQMARCELAVPVPADAAISAFRLDGLEGDPPAVLLPRDEAREAFEAIVRKMIDPGLLEFAGRGLIKSSVFPVPANGEQTFRLTYEHPVRGEGDEIEFTLPRSGAMGTGAPEWTVDVRVDTPEPIASVFSPSHAVEFAIDESGDAALGEVSLDAPGDFRFVALRTPSDAEDGRPAMSLFAYPDPEKADAGFFMLVVAAGERDADTEALPREVTIVLDRSGSMQGEKFEQARAAATQVVRALGEHESFRIIDYSSDVAQFGVGIDVRHNDRVNQAVAYLEGLKPVGGTNINEALMTAVRPDVVEGTLPIVLFLTDGLPTVGVTDEKSIRENILAANGVLGEGRAGARARRLFTFGVGHDVNVPLLTDLSRESRAIADFVGPGEDVEAAVGRVFSRLVGPVLADLHLGFETEGSGGGTAPFNAVQEVFPRQLGDLFGDQRLVVLGRYRDFDMLRLKVNGQGADGPVTHTIEFDPASASPANGHIARLWAQQKVTWLLDEIRSAGADPRVQQLDSLRDDPKLAELIDEVVHLSTTYGILTEYTAFLAAEDDVLTAGRAPQFDLGTVLQRANAERSGSAGVTLGEAQAVRRRSLRDARPLSVTDNFQISADTANGVTAAGQQGGGGGGMSPFRAPVSTAALGLDPSRGGRGMTIQEVGPDTLYNVDNRWVDAQIIRQDQARQQALAENPDNSGEDAGHAAPVRPEPDETVAFGTDRYFEIAAKLATQSRQGLMAVPGEVEIWLDGQRVLVQNPS